MRIKSQHCRAKHTDLTGTYYPPNFLYVKVHSAEYRFNIQVCWKKHHIHELLSIRLILEKMHL